MQFCRPKSESSRVTTHKTEFCGAYEDSSRDMAQIVEIKTVRGAEMMLRGKWGNQIFQVKNGKQIVMQMPQKRSSPPSPKEIEHRQRFATLTQAISRLTPEQWEFLHKEWKAAGYRFNGKKYCTLRGYAYGRLYKEWM